MNTEQLYQQRLNRYVTAMRNEKPDRIPIRPFVAEFTGTFAGYTCQEVAMDYGIAFEAAVRCARDFDWDAVVPNMVARRTLHDRFTLSGGIPNGLLSFGQPDEVREFCLRVIREVAPDGGYIMDAGAIMQDDTRVENLRALTEVTRQHGVYAAGTYPPPTATPPCDLPSSVADRQGLAGLAGRPTPRVRPGVCLPWEDKRQELPEITGNADLVRKVWDDVDAFGVTYIWQMLESF